MLLITILFAYLSTFPVDLDGDGQADFTTSYATASQQVNRMNPDWKESLQWMQNGTPATGMDMKKIYAKEGFVYPSEAYGVMSWWDYGHMITYIAERIPNSNPFQQGVAGPDGAAAYFVSTNETESNRILDVKQTQFVVTDIEMAVSKFWAMATWYNTTAQTAPFQMTMYARNQQNTNVLDPVTVNIQPYYLTTVARLHIFDGSETAPGTAYYIEYSDPSKAQTSLPLITRAESMNATDSGRASGCVQRPGGDRHARDRRGGPAESADRDRAGPRPLPARPRVALELGRPRGQVRQGLRVRRGRPPPRRGDDRGPGRHEHGPGLHLALHRRER